MRPVTDSWVSTARGSYPMKIRATVCQPLQVGVAPVGIPWSGDALGRIPVIDGTVQSDITADINSTLDLTTIYPWPLSATDFGTPYGQEIYVESGLQYGNGIVEYVGLGYFRIDTVDQARTPNDAIRITGKDRMASIQDARAISPIQFGAGASVASVIEFLVHEPLPGVPVIYDFSAATTFLTGAHIFEDDRLKFLQDLVTSYGKIMFFDYAGRLQIRNAPDPTKGSVYTINHGRGGVLASMSRQISRDGVYNAVKATGEAAGELPAVSGVAMDLVPTSPTRWSGPFGQVPMFFSSTFMTTDAQCQTAAAAALAKSVGLPYNVSLGYVPNAALETGDVVTVSYGDRYSAETHILDKITYPLKPGAVQTAETRKQFLS